MPTATQNTTQPRPHEHTRKILPYRGPLGSSSGEYFAAAFPEKAGRKKDREKERQRVRKKEKKKERKTERQNENWKDIKIESMNGSMKEGEKMNE